MPDDEELLQAIKSQRVGTQRQAKRKAQQVIFLTLKEEEDEKDIEEEDKEKEESKVQSLARKTIQVREKHIPLG